jgi:hypothetical protein
MKMSTLDYDTSQPYVVGNPLYWFVAGLGPRPLITSSAREATLPTVIGHVTRAPTKDSPSLEFEPVMPEPLQGTFTVDNPFFEEADSG